MPATYSGSYELCIKITDDSVIALLANKEIKRFPRNQFGAMIEVVRVGKFGPGFEARNYSQEGDFGSSRVSKFSMQ